MPALVTTGASLAVGVLFLVPFLWLCAAVGRRLLVWLGALGEASLAERGVIAVTLGAGALQFVPFALGAAGVLGVRSLRIALGVVVLASLLDLAKVFVRAREA
ncbi:MAG TPA: hypothetical protein VF103_17900, partial [Polyangiaceae bacterium]